MNRITQLAVESDLIEWEILPSGVRTPNHEDVAKVSKFAELIVEECIGTVIMSSDRHRKEYFAGLIKEHFGVE